MKSKLVVLAVFVSWALVGAEPARAGSLVVGNLDQPAAGAVTIQPNFMDIIPGLINAQEFNTGSLATSLDRVFASVGNYNAGDGSFVLSATLQADSSGTPGAVLATFSFNVADIPTSGFANVQFNPTGSFNLAANTNYWFVLSSTSDDTSGGVDWQYTNSTVTTGPGSLPQFNYSFDGGATWQGPFSGSPMLIQINGLVPEPAAWVLGGIGFGGVVVASRRRRGRARRDGVEPA